MGVAGNVRLSDGPAVDGTREVAASLLELLARALGVTRAALLVEDLEHARLVPLATLGDVTMTAVDTHATPPGEWDAMITAGDVGRARTLVLLAHDAGRLGPADLEFAQRVVEAAWRAGEHPRLESDLARSRELLTRVDQLSALGTFAASVAHDIRNPLVSVRTFVELFPERQNDPEFGTTFRDMTLSEIERMCGLIDDLLAFARPSERVLEPTDLNTVVAGIVRLLEAEARGRSVEVVVRPASDLPAVAAEGRRVTQALMNVVLNALQASPAGGRVEIGTAVEGEGTRRAAVVTVADAGDGVAEAIRERVFEAFFTTKEGGSGLGLYTARAVMTAHGGRIDVRPRPGGGTIFALVFPLGGAGGG